MAEVIARIGGHEADSRRTIKPMIYRAHGVVSRLIGRSMTRTHLARLLLIIRKP